MRKRVVKIKWRRAPTVVLSPLAEGGIDDQHSREFSDSMAPNPEWPDLADAPKVSPSAWTAARSAVDGLALRPRGLQPAAESLEPIMEAVAAMGVKLKVVEAARLVQFGAVPTAGCFVFARRVEEGVGFTLSWSPPLMSTTSP